MLRFLIISILTSYLFTSCDPIPGKSCAIDFDQEEMLINYADQLIIPVFTDFKLSCDSLKGAMDQFTQSPDQQRFTILRNQFQQCWLKWQFVAHFEFGPASDENLRSFMNNFPVFSDRIDQTLDSTSYDLSNEYYSFTRGFPALDYLLYGTDSNAQQSILKFTTDPKAPQRMQLTAQITDLIQQKANSVYEAWAPTFGNYRQTFISNLGVSNGSSISLLVNAFNQSYEYIKNNRMGNPVGAKTGYVTNPSSVEAFYSRTSLSLLSNAVESSRFVFEGGIDAPGLDDFLNATNAQKGGTLLTSLIKTQYSMISDRLTQTNSSLYDLVVNDPTSSQALYADIQNMVIYLKTDLPAALCISIVYNDNVDDGD